ncbi:MAG: virulence RhuM family protein [Planctomycetia bacterium]|nr:virulence RhuM family protein [Planctomycetia bacterium]
MSDNQNELILYQSDDGGIQINVRLEEDTVWLTQALIAELFGVAPQNITMHLQNIFSEGELDETATCKDFLQVRLEGNRQVNRKLKHYNLDAIIAVGYRVNSRRATQFRIWATKVLKEYIIKGFALNDERMKNGRNMNYFDELQERIREIRLSERVFYQKIKDIYTTSVDYDPSDEKTVLFFKTVQNKLLWAISQQTAAMLVARRANGELPFMGMQSYDKKNERRITKQDAITAKNYLSQDEIKALGLLVEQYLAFAESQAQQQIVMTMNDWIAKLDALLLLNGRELLTHAGSMSHELAKEVSEKQLGKLKERLRQEEIERSLDELEQDLKNSDLSKQNKRKES